MAGLEDLRKVVLSERESGRLTQIPPDLYAKAHDATAALMERVHAIDPFSDEARTLIEETVAIRETVFDLFAIRTKKTLSLAENQAQGHYIDREELRKLIPKEREMFDRIVESIGSCQDVLVQNSPQARLPDQPAVAVPRTKEPAAVQVSASMGSGEPVESATPVVTAGPAAAENIPALPEQARKPSSPVNPQYILVRVLADMDTFMGVDGKTYDLAQGDIVMLPERNAEVLVERNIALNMNVCK